MPSADRLELVTAKIERAKKHIHDLESLVEMYVSSNPYKVITNEDGQTGKRSTRIADILTVPMEISTVLGDAIQNLRSSLDHLMFQLVYVGGGAPTNRTMFPIYKSPTAHRSMDVRKIKGISKAAKDMIDALQPYRSGDATLWGLEELNRIDKHRLLLTIGHYHENVILDLSIIWREAFPDSSRDVPPFRIALRPADTAVQEGTELYSAPLDGLGSQMNKNAKFTLGVTFGDSEVFKGKPLFPTIQHLSDFIKAILEKFRPLLI